MIPPDWDVFALLPVRADSFAQGDEQGNAHSAAVKGIKSEVCGNADLLIFSNIDAGNTFYKTITQFASATVAGILQGPVVPVLLSSRSDSPESKFYSLALACINRGC